MRSPLMRTCLIALVAMIAWMGWMTTAQAADPQPRTISTSGTAIVYVTPDQVVVTFGIETFDADMDKATSANNSAAAKLVAAIKGLGVEEKYVQTDRLEVQIAYHFAEEQRNKIAGYYARRSYSVKLKDVKLFNKLIETGLKNGANQLHGVDFQTTEIRKYRDQARQMAIKAAKEKAVALANELDCKVGKPLTITEGSAGYSIGNLNVSRNVVQSVAQATAEGDANSDTLPLGQIAVQASVNVTFDLND